MREYCYKDVRIRGARREDPDAELQETRFYSKQKARQEPKAQLSRIIKNLNSGNQDKARLWINNKTMN